MAIIGGGVLGTSIAYFLSAAGQPGSVVLIEQEAHVGYHTSSRNTGKVHAPFLYDPVKKGLFAKAASLGYDMWKSYASKKGLLFKQDGVLEVATDESSIDRLYRYMQWGLENGLLEKEIRLVTKQEAQKMEPAVRCSLAVYCSKDASVDYGSLTQSLLEDCTQQGCRVLIGHKVQKIVKTNEGYNLLTNRGHSVTANFIINSAGGNAIDIAHSMGVAAEFTDLHFRGEYWQAPEEYRTLTKLSIYSVPKFPDYPFLDPHWIVRANGTCEVGPNAVPVFGPYAYTWSKNLTYILPKIFESSTTGARKMIFDRQFMSLVGTELKSSLSKTAMINRVRKFLPQVEPSKFVIRGTSGIRSSVIDRAGRFISDTMILEREGSLHVINYNSPGATGALPMATMIASRLVMSGQVAGNWDASGGRDMLWDVYDIAEKMEDAANGPAGQ